MQTNPLAAMAGRVKTELASRQPLRRDDGAGAAFDQLLRDKAAGADAAPGADASAPASTGGGPEPGLRPGSAPAPRPAEALAADGYGPTAPAATGTPPIAAVPGDGGSPLVATSLAGPSRGVSSDGGMAGPDGACHDASMPALLAAGAKAGWPRAAMSRSQDDAPSAESATAALADAGSRAMRAVPAETALPPGAAAAAPDPSATVAKCEAMLRYGVTPAGPQAGAAWEVVLNDTHSIPMTLRAQRSDGAAPGSSPPPAWTLTISTPALGPLPAGTSALGAPAFGSAAFGTPVVDAALLQRHLPRLLERLKTHALAPGHVRIEADDDGR